MRPLADFRVYAPRPVPRHPAALVHEYARYGACNRWAVGSAAGISCASSSVDLLAALVSGAVATALGPAISPDFADAIIGTLPGELVKDMAGTVGLPPLTDRDVQAVRSRASMLARVWIGTQTTAPPRA